MSQAFGIDFGTTNSVVATYAGGAVDVLTIDTPPHKWNQLGMERVFPSVLGVTAGDVVTAGWTAKMQTERKLEAVKRLFATEELVDIGGRKLSVELAAATLFGHLKAATAAAGTTMGKAVVTIPANSRGIARFRTKACAGLAGITVPVLLNEPTAAAMAQSIAAEDDQTLLVFDWGGGTLDVTILETIAGVFMERASKGIQRLGGIDIDRALEAALTPRVTGHESWDGSKRALFRLDVERTKIELSTKPVYNLELPDGGFLDVTQDELRQVIRPLVDRTRGPIEQCLRDLKIDAGAIDHVVLVGGSSKIPAVQEFVSEVLGKAPTGTVDPLTAVAEGAAIAAAILDEQLDADFFVSLEHALGTYALDPAGDRLELSVLIPRNRSLPASGHGSYLPVHDRQEAINVEVVEGDPEVPIDHEDNVVLKEWTLKLDPTRAKEESGFELIYDYDRSGILHVTAIDHKTRQELLHEDVSFGATSDKAGLVQTAQEVKAILESGLLSGRTSGQEAARTEMTTPTVQLDPAAAELVARVRDKVIPFVDPAEARRLESLCKDHEMSGGTSTDCAEALERECQQYAYLFT